MTEHKRLTTKEKYPHGAEGVSKDKLTGKYFRGVFEEMPEMRAVYDATFKLCVWDSVHSIFLLLRIFRRYMRSQVRQQNNLYGRWSK